MAHPALEYINTAVSLATFLISKELPATIDNIRSYFSTRKSIYAQKFQESQEIALVQKLVIDSDLLDTLKTKVKGAISDEADCVKKAKRPQENEACKRKAERNVCDHLNYIMDRNNGALPTDFLTDSWASYGCVRV